MEEHDRPRELCRAFTRAFPGSRPRWLVRVPGRINLIGEHTDYNGFPVMPIAIDRAVLCVAAPRTDSTVALRNAADGFPDRSFEVSENIEPAAEGGWSNYVRAAAQALARWGRGRLGGVSCLVDGNVPMEAGLSSSTALLIAGALALAAANDLEADPRALAEEMAEAERYVGTRGGGMDQAACLLSEPGAALKIDFFPLRTRRVPFPDGYCVIAAHSTRSARKSGGAREAFNLRVAECRAGAHILARATGVPPPARLAALADNTADLPDLLDRLSAAVGGAESLPVPEAAAICGMQESVFVESVLCGDGGLARPPEALKVLPRCRHVFSEARRTERAAELLAECRPEAAGRLMNESHSSCATDYEISCPELDRLVELMRDAGAAGARLTGAGFGGFAVALVREDLADQVLEAVTAGFYRPRGLRGDDWTYCFKPASGATVSRLG